MLTSWGRRNFMTCSMNRSEATEASGRVEGDEVRIERDELLSY